MTSEQSEQIKVIQFLDDHVWAENAREYLRHAMAPFENDRIGAVATAKDVESIQQSPYSSCLAFLAGLLNCEARFYLARHNERMKSTDAADGSVFVVSGRAALYRADIVCERQFLPAYTEERWPHRPKRFVWLPSVGPLNADDDNFKTRWIESHGFGIKFQSTARVITVLGVDGWRTFVQQMLCWSRTTYRSNAKTLCNLRVWKQQPYTMLTDHFVQLLNFALVFDVALLWNCYSAAKAVHVQPVLVLAGLMLWMSATKLFKIRNTLQSTPGDWIYVLLHFLFGWMHSVLKFYSLLTMLRIGWGSRKLGGECVRRKGPR
ncbi:glycosyltransferase family 2 protein [Sphaerobolus stellatus SS14]|nr:glycosyltransferase family 2 protein [Sphaerobolus stellatus SS14]